MNTAVQNQGAVAPFRQPVPVRDGRNSTLPDVLTGAPGWAGSARALHESESRPDPDTKPGSMPSRGALAVGSSIAVTALGNFRSWGLDRSRLVYSLVEQARSPQAKRLPLALGFAVGLPVLGHGLLTTRQAYSKHGITGMFGDSQAMQGVAETALGVGAVALGLHQGLPTRLTLLKDFFRGPTTKSIPVTGRGWGMINKMSNGISSSMAIMTIGASALNIWDGVSKNGPDGLITHKSGRTGLIYGLGAGIGLGFNLRAGLKYARPGEGFLSAAVGAEWLNTSRIKNIRYGIGLATGGLWLANELGALDWLNTKR